MFVSNILCVYIAFTPYVSIFICRPYHINTYSPHIHRIPQYGTTSAWLATRGRRNYFKSTTIFNILKIEIKFPSTLKLLTLQLTFTFTADPMPLVTWNRYGYTTPHSLSRFSFFSAKTCFQFYFLYHGKNYILST